MCITLEVSNDFSGPTNSQQRVVCTVFDRGKSRCPCMTYSATRGLLYPLIIEWPLHVPALIAQQPGICAVLKGAVVLHVYTRRCRSTKGQPGKKFLCRCIFQKVALGCDELRCFLHHQCPRSSGHLVATGNTTCGCRPSLQSPCAVGVVFSVFDGQQACWCARSSYGTVEKYSEAHTVQEIYVVLRDTRRCTDGTCSRQKYGALQLPWFAWVMPIVCNKSRPHYCLVSWGRLEIHNTKRILPRLQPRRQTIVPVGELYMLT